MQGNAVSLFSGGLDSFIGAIDWLYKNPDRHLHLVGHYDRHVPGPLSDQEALATRLRQQFPKRFDSVHVQVGLREKGADTNFRSRSFLFLALAVYVAEKLGPDVPVFIPENGPIALNIPLIPTRRGSCSTRTAHPYFLSSFNGILQATGFDHEISNPYQFRTKGEMVNGCAVPTLLAAHVERSLSCAKSGHTYHWENDTARGCGRCVPCLFRRASLYGAGLDNELYGYDVCASNMTRERLNEDTLALLAFLRRNPGRNEIARMLMSNGPIALSQIGDSVDVIIRLIDEMREFFRAKASVLVRELAGIA
jgi:7-cyano-7-deazaguanine synthase in queuosine biosynthesis